MSKRPQMDPVTEMAMFLHHYTGRRHNIHFNADKQNHYIIPHEHIEAPHMLPADVKYLKAMHWEYDYINKIWEKNLYK